MNNGRNKGEENSFIKKNIIDIDQNNNNKNIQLLSRKIINIFPWSIFK